MRIVGWRSSLKALALVLMAIALLFSESRILGAVSWLHLYQNQFAFAPGDWFAWRLNDTRRDPERTCLLLGTSSVREGLSASLIEEFMHGIKVVNLATTGGKSTIDVIEIQARALASLGGHYKCVVVGLHPLFLREFEQQSYNLVTTDYAAVMPLSGVFDLSRPAYKFSDKGSLLLKYLMPLGQHSLVLKRLIRSWLYEAHHLYVDASTPRRNYEEFAGEFTPQPQLNYSGPSVLREIEESYPAAIREMGWDRAEFYGGRREAAALHHSLKLLSGITSRLIVLEMPESHLFDKVNAVARKAYETALWSADSSKSVLRCEIPVADQYRDFHDAIHLGESGRRIVSRSVARFLAEDRWSGIQADPASVCRIRSELGEGHISDRR